MLVEFQLCGFFLNVYQYLNKKQYEDDNRRGRGAILLCQLKLILSAI